MLFKIDPWILENISTITIIQDFMNTRNTGQLDTPLQVLQFQHMSKVIVRHAPYLLMLNRH